jgi:hypothetical protein
MDYAIITVPAAPVRRKPNHRKEMVSQILFGETVEILKSKGELWIKVRGLQDGYEGWITNTQVSEIPEAEATAMCAFVSSGLFSPVSMENNLIFIPAGSSLPLFEEYTNGKKGGIGKIAGIPFTISQSAWNRNDQVLSPEIIRQLTTSWLNAPYLWGGRTPMGVDCSGFVQVIFKMLGIDLPRDAWQQAREGRSVKKFSEICPGDLAFFHNKEEIVHVGIMLGNEEIIHASGKVRVDRISKKYLVNSDSGKKGWRLKTVRRIW